MKNFRLGKFINPDLKKIASNTFYQLISKVITMSITFALTIIISKEYGAKGYGLFSIIQSFPALFYLIADFGLNAIATREMSKNHQDSQKIFENTVFLRGITSLLAIATCIILSIFIYNDPEVRYGILLGSIIIISQTLMSTVNIIFQIKLRYELFTISNIVGYILILFLTLILVNFKVGVVYLNFIYVLGSFVSLGCSLYFLRRFSFTFKPSFQKELSKNLLLDSLPLGFMFLFSQINMRADSILLSTLKIPQPISNIEAVGVYALPYKFFEVILVIPTFMMNAIYPVLLKKYQETKATFNHFFLKVLSYMGAIGLVTSVCGVLFVYLILSGNLIINFFGTEFADSGTLLLILSSGLVFFFLTQPLSWYLVIKGKQGYLPKAYLIASIFNVGLNFFLIPYFGYFASSVITIASEFLILVMLGFYAYTTKDQN